MSLKTEIIKLLNKIDKIAKIGPDGVFDYYNLISGLIDDGKYYLFDRAMLEGYSIDINKYKSVDEMRKVTFPLIRLNTNSYLQDYIKKLYDTNGVYQVGQGIYDSSSNVLLGLFTEIPPILTQSYVDPEFALYKDKYSYTSLEVVKVNIPTDTVDFDNNILLLNDNTMILFKKYVEAIKFILDVDYIDVSYVDEGYVI